MNIEAIATSVWEELERGETALKNPVTRINVDESLRRNGILQNPQDFDEHVLMKEFFKAFMRDWPNHTNLEYVEPYLEALQNMRKVINVTEVNEHVAVFNDPCRVEDPRQDLAEFRRRLTELVLHEWGESCADEDRAGRP